MIALYGEETRKKKKLLTNEFLIVAVFMFQIFYGYLAEILTVYGLAMPSTLVYVVIYLLALLSWFKAMEKNPLFCFSILGTVAVLISLVYLSNSSVTEYIFNFGNGTLYEIAISNIAILLGLCLPPFVLCSCGVDFALLRKHLYHMGMIALILFTIMMFLQSFAYAQTINYMTVAYNALPCFFFIYFEARDKHKKSAYVIAATTFFGLFIGGCRGALLSAVVFVFLLEGHLLAPLTTKKLFTICVFAILAVVVLVQLEEIITWLDSFLNSFGYSSRLLDKFLDQSADGDLFQFSDRQEIIDRTLENITLLGHGVYGDRVVLRGTYPHNIVLEILCQYGIFFGTAILIMLLRFFLRLRKKVKVLKNNYLHMLYLAFSCTIFVKMMFSASYLTDRPFWLFLGLCCAILNTKQAVEQDNPLKDPKNIMKVNHYASL